MRGFSHDKSRLYVFDKKASDPSSKFRYQTTEKIAYEKNLYTYRNTDLQKETLEDFFSVIEGKAKKAIDKLEQKKDLTPKERGHLALFVALLWLRTPTSRNETLGAQEELAEKMIRMQYHHPHQKELMKKFFEERGETKTDEEIDDLIAFARDPERSKISIDFPPEHWIQQLLEFANDTYIYLAHCEWEIMHTVKKYAYITSDYPFLLIPSEKPHPFYGVGLLTPGVKKTVPLTASMYLVMHEPQKEGFFLRHTMVDKKFYVQANEWTMKNAERFVFGADKGKMEKMAKQKPKLATPRGKRYRVS